MTLFKQDYTALVNHRTWSALFVLIFKPRGLAQWDTCVFAVNWVVRNWQNT